jgi:predicted nucleic acid-binding protein
VTLFILDASVALSWIFHDERSTYAEAIANELESGQAIVPAIWPLEIANALLVAVRRGRLLEVDPPILIGTLSRLQIEVDHVIAPESLVQTTVALGLATRLSSYDASYLELALRRRLPLATLDSRLARAAEATGVTIMQP